MEIWTTRECTWLLGQKEVKCYNLERDCFRLDDSGVIWHQIIGDSGDAKRFLVPRTLRDEIMRLS